MKRARTSRAYDRFRGDVGAGRSGGRRRSKAYGNRRAGRAVQGEFTPPKTITPALPAVGSFAELTTELITGESVTIGRRRHPVRQAGRIITRQVSRGFTSGEVVRAVTRLGFTCHEHPVIAPAGFPAPLQVISALLGRTAALEA